MSQDSNEAPACAEASSEIVGSGSDDNNTERPAEDGGAVGMERGRRVGSGVAQQLVGAMSDDRPYSAPGEMDDRDRQSEHGSPLLSIAEQAHLFRSPAGDVFASFDVNGIHQTWPVRSRQFRAWLQSECLDSGESLPKRAEVDQTIEHLDGYTSIKGPTEPVHIRLAEHDSAIYLDLGDERWRAVRIEASGWSIVDRPPVTFVRPNGMMPLPEPKPGGSLYDLRPFVNVSDDEFDLVLMFEVGCLRPNGAYPVLSIVGESGSAKSTTSRYVRSVVDPSAVPLRARPKDGRDFFITAENNWVVAVDNLSSLPAALADAVCQITSGTGATHRANYTDREEVIFDAARPIIINSILERLTLRADVQDRTLVVRCRPITDVDRRGEQELADAFEAAHPKILGALCDAGSTALRRRSQLRPAALPRLADFALFCEAAAESLGWEEGKAIEVLLDHRRQARDNALIESPVAQAVLALRPGYMFGGWSGTATELLKELNDTAAPEHTGHKEWPKAANALSGALDMLEPALREQGVSIDRDRTGHKGTRTMTIRWRAVSPNSQEPPGASADDADDLHPHSSSVQQEKEEEERGSKVGAVSIVSTSPTIAA